MASFRAILPLVCFVVGSYPLLWANVSAASDESIPLTRDVIPVAEEPLRFYPRGELVFVPPAGTSPDRIRVHLLEEGVSTQLSEPRYVKPEPDGTFRVEVECHFVGPGTLEIVNPASRDEERLLSEIDLHCGHPARASERRVRGSARPRAFVSGR